MFRRSTPQQGNTKGEKRLAGKSTFDEIIDRRGTSCIKYDFGPERKGRDDLLPLWVADMDFRLPREILDDIKKRVDHGIFGYTDPREDYFGAVKGWFAKRHGWEVKSEWITVTPGVAMRFPPLSGRLRKRAMR